MQTLTNGADNLGLLGNQIDIVTAPFSDRFLEIAPALADKARAVREIMSEHTPSGALAV